MAAKFSARRQAISPLCYTFKERKHFPDASLFIGQKCFICLSLSSQDDHFPNQESSGSHLQGMDALNKIGIPSAKKQVEMTMNWPTHSFQLYFLIGFLEK
jgi:hypothetical protein